VSTNPVLRNSKLRPEQIERLELAYKYALRALSLTDRRDDPLTEMIARKILEIDATGVSDPSEISEIAVKQLSTSAKSS
jgi:hypothetical protein